MYSNGELNMKTHTLNNSPIPSSIEKQKSICMWKGVRQGTGKGRKKYQWLHKLVTCSSEGSAIVQLPYFTKI